MASNLRRIKIKNQKKNHIEFSSRKNSFSSSSSANQFIEDIEEFDDQKKEKKKKRKSRRSSDKSKRREKRKKLEEKRDKFESSNSKYKTRILYRSENEENQLKKRRSSSSKKHSSKKKPKLDEEIVNWKEKPTIKKSKENFKERKSSKKISDEASHQIKKNNDFDLKIENDQKENAKIEFKKELEENDIIFLSPNKSPIKFKKEIEEDIIILNPPSIKVELLKQTSNHLQTITITEELNKSNEALERIEEKSRVIENEKIISVEEIEPVNSKDQNEKTENHDEDDFINENGSDNDKSLYEEFPCSFVNVLKFASKAFDESQHQTENNLDQIDVNSFKTKENKKKRDFLEEKKDLLFVVNYATQNASPSQTHQPNNLLEKVLESYDL